MKIDIGSRPDIVRTRALEQLRDVVAARSTRPRGASASESFELSGLGTTVRALAQRVLADDEAARAVRLRELKDMVGSGEYRPDAARVAEAMMAYSAV
jgi:flagellar biosynthesis anti-sigma factor FlgM